jgi:hypothetical protein
MPAEPPVGIFAAFGLDDGTDARFLVDESFLLGDRVRIALHRFEGGIPVSMDMLVVPRRLWDEVLAVIIAERKRREG